MAPTPLSSPGIDAPVTAVRASACTVPTDGPEADGTIAWDATTLVLVEVSGGGRTGLGYTYAPAAAVGLVHDLLAPVVTGAPTLAPAATHESMRRAVRNAGPLGLATMALSAVDVALWDLAGRLLDQPLARLWGGPVSSVPAYGSGGFTTYDDARTVHQLAGWVETGLSMVKIKIGESWGRAPARDLHRTRLARRTVGDDVELFVDANGGYSVGQACRIGRALDDLGVAWFEEPVSSRDPAGLERVRESVLADVAAGEYAQDDAGVLALAGSVDCVQLDVTRCGGYTGWLRLSAVAEALERDVSVHCAPSVSLPVAALAPRLRHVEWFHDHVRIEQRLFEGAPRPHEGRLEPSDRPGHGLSLRRGAFEAHRVA